MDSSTAFFCSKTARKWAQNGRFEAFTSQLFPYERRSPSGEGRGIVKGGIEENVTFVSNSHIDNEKKSHICPNTPYVLIAFAVGAVSL